ncbi:MAG: RAMP superfamily CRISPR-associated protein [Methylosarcina sp.]
MSFLKHYTLKYTPLSPIHIGTGDSYEPTNYVIDDGTLYEFDTGGAVAAFTARDRDELIKIVNGKANEHMLKAVQKFFYDRRDALKPWARNAIPVLDGVARLYKDRVGQAANRENGGKQIINKLEIDRTAYNPVNRQPILFGSSLKGAIRTALLNQTNNKKPLLLTEDRRTGRKRKENNLELQQRLFHFRAGKFELDPLRLVQISDAAWNEQNDLPTAQVLLTVNRKKHKVVDEHGSERASQADKNENLNKLLECVPAWRYRAFSGQIAIQQVNNLPPQMNSRLPKENLRFTMDEIAKTCSAFYMPMLKAELEIMRERDFLDKNWDKNIQELLSRMADKLMKGQAFLLRVGRHSGAQAVTLNGVRHIKIMKGKDQKPDYADSPKTLWLAAQSKDQRTGLLPFGWLLVEIEPAESTSTEWPELAALCAGQHHESRQWSEKQALQKADLAEKRREAEQRRDREETERRRQAEFASQAEQERLARELENRRLESMTAEQLQIEALKQQLRQKQAVHAREQIGGPLYSALRELIGGAAAWSTEDKADLLGVARDILKFIGADGNKKAKELLKTLQQ